MRVLVCGGRDYNGVLAVAGALDDLLSEHGELVVIQGGAAGADAFAKNWVGVARSHGHRVKGIEVRADWNKHGRAAGPIRNQRMLDEHKPDLVLAFPGGRGTADMVRRAEAAGVPVVTIAPKD